jgi:hypothetical protein
VRLVVAPLVLAACSFHSPSIGAGDAGRDVPSIDGPVDAAIDAGIDGRIDASVCSAAGLVCPGSTPIMFQCGGDCWAGCTNGTPVTQPVAVAACKTWGGRLTPVYNATELSCVRAAIAPGSAMWLGLVQDPTATTPSAGWSWNGDGVGPPYLDWAPGQPNDGDGDEDGEEQCAYSSTQANWQDEPCASLFARFACRQP